MYNLTIYTISGRLYSFTGISLSLARDLVARMGRQVDSANYYNMNQPIFRLKG